MRIPKYYESENSFEAIHHALKQYPCPFCRLIGCLILHGFLSGYSDTDCSCTIRRRHRVFCSNRNNRKGCGRTSSILLSDFIKCCLFTARTIWRFLIAITSGSCKTKAWWDTNVSASRSTPYRVWNRLRTNTAPIRTILSGSSPPADGVSSDPNIQTIEHLKTAFNGSKNPISAFQRVFQISFFSIISPKPGMLLS